MLRGYCKFLLQVGVPFSQSYVEETFSRYPLLARLLVELFEARFDPRREKPGKAELTEGRERFAGQLGMLCGDDAEALKRSEEHTSELQSLMRISYAVFCLKKNKKTNTRTSNAHHTYELQMISRVKN